MPIYRCPICGRIVDKPEGTYYCSKCGIKDTPMVKISEEENTLERFLLAYIRKEHPEVPLEEARKTAKYVKEFLEWMADLTKRYRLRRA